MNVASRFCPGSLSASCSPCSVESHTKNETRDYHYDVNVGTDQRRNGGFPCLTCSPLKEGLSEEETEVNEVNVSAEATTLHRELLSKISFFLVIAVVPTLVIMGFYMILLFGP